ncbi:MAG: outer membrane beta-barrel family protein [Ginsengibacter sp.]
MKTSIALSTCMFLSVLAKAQYSNTGEIKVFIKNDNQTALENVTVSLMKSQDSSLVKLGISDDEGSVYFDHIPYGFYIIKATMTNYDNTYSGVINVTSSQKNETVLSLDQKSAIMKEVKVEGKKPFIQKLSDRIVVNVDNSIISAGSSAMDVLERSPGVTIDQNDAISLRGKQGVIIMIDGKTTPMTGTDLANYLRGLPSDAIDRIDIITNPSAKYDAAGNSGIIDIHMKKDQRLGANGSATAGYGQGVFPKSNAGMNFNYRNKKVNVFGNYNYAYRKGLNHLILDRNFYTNGVFNGEDKKDNYTTFPLNFNVARLGADFFLDKKSIIGFVVNSNFIIYHNFNTNNSTVIDKQKNSSYTFQTHENSSSDNNNTVANINFKHTFDSTGKELTADLDYGVYRSYALTNNATNYYKLDGSILQPAYILLGNQHGKLTLKTAKADYVNPLKNGSKLEAGFKTSDVSSDNDAKFFDASSGTPQNDTTRTNHFLYEEFNHAGYVNFSKECKKFNIQLGLRGEQTILKTHQEKGDIRFDSSYFQLFPSAFFNYKINKDQTLGISVSRRIDRPNYSLLNPFLFLIDVSTYNTGNTALLPQFTWSYEINYTVKNFNVALSYSYTKDVLNVAIAKFKDVFPKSNFADSNITVEIPVNLDASDYVGLSVSAPLRITSWWNMTNNADFYYNHFRGNLGGSALNNGAPAADIKTNNNLTFKKGWSAELNASFNSGGRDGYMVAQPQWAISPGFQKSILKTKGTLKFSYTDIFWTNLPKAVITYPGKYIERWHAFRESRIATFAFTYRFGKSTVQGARRRTTGSEEERQRAGS